MAKKNYADKEVADWSVKRYACIPIRPAPRTISTSTISRSAHGRRSAAQLGNWIGTKRKSRQVWARVYEAVRGLVPGGLAARNDAGGCSGGLSGGRG